MYDSEIRGVMVSSKGYGQYEGRDVKTTILRHVIGNIDPHDYAKIEPLMDNLTMIPVLNKKGVMIR